MTSMRLTSLVKPVLIFICAVAFSISAFNSAAAKSRTKAVRKTSLTVSAAKATANNAGEARRTLLRELARKIKANPKLAKAVAAACNDLDGSGGGCFKNCLADWGISYGSGTTCAGLCVLAGSTANPFAIAGCAACVGTAEWIIAGCAMRCVWRNYMETY